MENTDDIKVEEEQPTPSSEEEQIPSQEGKETIPYERFKEVIDDKNEMKDNLQTLQQEIETLKQQRPEVEEEEPLDWKEAEKRAVNKAVTKMEESAKKVAEESRKQDQRIEKSFEQLEEIGQKITPDIRRTVLTKMIKTGSKDVLGTYLTIKEQIVKTEKVEQLKKEGFVPSSQKGSVAGKPGLSYKQLRDTPLDEIVERASKAEKQS